LAVGVAASVGANILHARPEPVAQAIAAWPPLALLATVELVSRIPARRRLLGVGRVAATVVIAGIAGWVSYWHMTAVAARYGETPTAAHLLPVSVDGLIVVASISLVELATHNRSAAVHTGQSAGDPAPSPARPKPDESTVDQPEVASLPMGGRRRVVVGEVTR
jgi:hypothetical protein